MSELKQKLIETAESLEWSVHIEGNGWEFEKYSPAGEDFFFYVTVEDPEDVWREVRLYAADFDPDEHIRMLVNAENTSGVPSIRQLVEDADDIQEMLDEFGDALLDATNDFSEKEN